MNFWDRLTTEAEKQLDGLIASGLNSAANKFGLAPKPNQDPTAAQVAAGQQGSQPDGTIYPRDVAAGL